MGLILLLTTVVVTCAFRMSAVMQLIQVEWEKGDAVPPGGKFCFRQEQ